MQSIKHGDKKLILEIYCDEPRVILTARYNGNRDGICAIGKNMTETLADLLEKIHADKAVQS